MLKTEIKQRDITDCGAACIASIAAHYNLMLPVARIRQIASTDQRGTNVLGITVAAEKLGFAAKGVKSLNADGTVNLEPLHKVPLPAIAHIVIDGRLQHYVVIYSVAEDWVEIMDPGTGKLEKRNIEEFAEQWSGVLVLMMPDEDRFQEGSEKVSILSRLLYLLKPHRSVVTQSIFGALIYTVLGLSMSIFVQKIIDYVIPNSNSNLLNLMGVVMVTILLVNGVINHCKSIFILKTGQQIDARLILGYYKHLLRLPQSFFDTMRTGEIMSRVGDAVKIRTFINSSFISLIVSIFTVVFAFALMFTYYWKLALVIFTIIPIYIAIYWLYNRVNRKTLRKIMEESADLESHLIETVNTAKTIKSFGIEEHVNIKSETRFVKLLKTTYKSGVNSLWASNSTDFLSNLFTVILLWCGSYYVIGHEITAGELLSFYALIGYFTGPVASLITMNQEIQDAYIASDRLFEIMDLEREKNENKMEIGAEQVGDITLANVSFAYGTRADIFNDLSLTIKKGELTAIVGESGSGKSTIASLLQNLYPLNGGCIRIGEVDIRHIEIASLREIVSVVPQKLDLFEGSVLENIALGEYAPDMQRIFEICSSLGIMEFIDSLPSGMATNIGENGVMLSGGQRQRLAIARALYRDPEVLILDEATSALDSISEEHVKKVIAGLKEQGKTVIVIAHRLGTVTTADNIIVLKNGEVAGEGNHKQLLKENEHYKNLVQLQMS